MWARLRKRPIQAGLALSGALHLVVLTALLSHTSNPGTERLAAAPPMDIVLARQASRANPKQDRAPSRPPAPTTLSPRPSPATTVNLPALPLAGAVPPARADSQLASALRNSAVACPLLGALFADRAARLRCADRLGANLATTRRVDGIPPAKAALYDEVAFEQEEARAFSYRPTASTVRPVGAGEIGGGPASDEIFSHNVGDPSPPKDPLLRREARRLGPAIP